MVGTEGPSGTHLFAEADIFTSNPPTPTLLGTRSKRAVRILLWTLTCLALLPVLLAGLIWWQKDRLIGIVVERCNERLKTPVRVDRIDLTIWSTFPRVAVQMDSVIIQESCGDHTARMAALGQVQFGFSPWDMLHGTYEVAFLRVRGGHVNMRHLADGTINYDIIRKDTTAASGKPSGFALRQIQLDSIRYRFADEGPAATLVSVRLAHGDAALRTGGSLTTVSLKTEGGQIHRLIVGNNRLAQELPVKLDNVLEIEAGKELRFKPATIRLGTADFAVEGRIGLDTAQGQYRFHLENEGSSLAALAILLPACARQELEKYRSKGQVYFKGDMESTQRGMRFPKITAQFGTKRAHFEHPAYKMSFSDVSLMGSFQLPEGQTLETAQLSLKKAQGTLAGHPFTAEIELRNLVKPQVKGFAKARLPLAFFTPQLAESGIVEPSGDMDLDIRFATTAKGLTKAEGSVDLQGLGFLAGNRKLKFEGWQGSLALEGEVLTAQALSGRIGRTDLALEGRLENLLGYLAGTRPALALEVGVQSQYLDLDELLAAAPGSSQAEQAAAAKTGESQDYRFAIAPGLRLSAQCQVGQLRFRRFSPRSIRGQVEVSNQRLSLEGVRFYEVGGLFQVSGSLDARPELMQLESRYAVEGARMDSLFYVMEDFNQTTLKSNQIQGRLTAKGTLSMGLNHKLEVAKPSVTAAAEISLTDGALLYFEPAQALGSFIDKEELKYLRFSALENKITIQNEVLTIPEMDIRSNVFRCYVRGTQTFRQDMDYHLRVPMKYIRKSSLEAEGSELGGNLMLVMRGRPGHLKVGYDVAAVKDKIKNDFKEEKQNFLNLFKRKPQTVKPEEKPAEEPKSEEPAASPFLDLD